MSEGNKPQDSLIQGSEQKYLYSFPEVNETMKHPYNNIRKISIDSLMSSEHS